jgi:dTDP-4-dehydrorhamnose reductase
MRHVMSTSRHRPLAGPAPAPLPPVHAEPPAARQQLSRAASIVIVGASGTLGRAFTAECQRRDLACVPLSHGDLDITDPVAVRAVLGQIKPWAVINAAGFARVDGAEHDRVRCRRVNAVGATLLAASCRVARIRLLTFSSALIFDGRRAVPYVESDRPSPLNIYGRTKLEAERRVTAILPDALVVRTSALFDPWDPRNFVTQALQTLASGQRLRAAADETVSPTYVPDLVDAALNLLLERAGGVWHLVNSGAVTWAELAALAASAAGIDGSRIVTCAGGDLGRTASRPLYSVLGTERGIVLPDLAAALARYVRTRDALGSAA